MQEEDVLRTLGGGCAIQIFRFTFPSLILVVFELQINAWSRWKGLFITKNLYEVTFLKKLLLDAVKCS